MAIGAQLPDVAAQSKPQNVPAFDPIWVETKSKKVALKLEKLDSDLENYKSNSIKESIRRGHDDLGDHYLSCGDLSKRVVNMCLNVIRVSIYLQKLSTLDFVDGKDTNELSTKNYKSAAKGAAEECNF